MTPAERAVAALFAPRGVAAFRRDVRGQRAMRWAPSRARLAAFQAVASWSIDDVLADHRGNATAWFESTAGRHLTADMSPTAARRLYDGGTSIYLREVVGLAPLGAALAADLSMPGGDVLCAVFFNQPGARTQVHFDPVDTIAVQIAGTKTWRLAPNEHATNPTSTGIPGERSPSPELAQYARTPMPTSIPDGATTYRLTPGAALYVPRGYWHETTVEDESVSLHLHLVATSWLDVVLDTMRGRLVREASLRAGADDLRDPTHRDAALAAASSALDTLRVAVAELTADDLVPPPVTAAPAVAADSTLVRRASAGLRIGHGAGSTTRALVTVVVDEHGQHRETTIEMPAAHVVACRRLADTTPVSETTPAALAATTALDVRQATELTQLLVDSGYLRVGAPSGAHNHRAA